MRKKLLKSFSLLPILSIFLVSCLNQKQIAYFQKGVNQSDTIAVSQAYIPKIQPGDILSITIGSLNPVASSFFNPYSAVPLPNDNTSNGTAAASASSGSNSSPGTALAPATGFLVDSAGTIELPLIGILKVSGLTTSQARDVVKNHLKTYLKEPTVNVRFLNYKISVMGEVARPSVYIVPNERITLLEALSMAGDMTIFGKRDNVLVIRDIDGKKEFGRVNLNTRDVYASPYYYLHANDVVYVEPSKGRIAQTDKTYQILPIVLSALSFLSIIFVYGLRK